MVTGFQDDLDSEDEVPVSRFRADPHHSSSDGEASKGNDAASASEEDDDDNEDNGDESPPGGNFVVKGDEDISSDEQFNAASPTSPASSSIHSLGPSESEKLSKHSSSQKPKKKLLSAYDVEVSDSDEENNVVPKDKSGNRTIQDLPSVHSDSKNAHAGVLSNGGDFPATDSTSSPGNGHGDGAETVGGSGHGVGSNSDDEDGGDQDAAVSVDGANDSTPDAPVMLISPDFSKWLDQFELQVSLLLLN